MGAAHHHLHRGRPARPHAEQQLRFEADMGELIGDQHAAERPESFAIRGRFERPVVDRADELGTDQYVEIEFKARESS